MNTNKREADHMTGAEQERLAAGERKGLTREQPLSGADSQRLIIPCFQNVIM